MKKPAQTPEHKPNPRHALNEVMHGLQDVLNNELSDVANEETAPRAEPRQRTARDEPEQETILGSLRSFLGGSRKNTAAPKQQTTSPANRNEVAPLSDDELELPPEFDTREPEDPGRYDIEETVRLDAGKPSPPDPENFALEILQPSSSAAPATPPVTPVPAKEKTTPNGKAATAQVSQLEISWDDIPVLNEIVMPPPEEFQGTVAPEVRDVAIKVAAALNIELKRAGKQTLDVKMIMQLQNLLQKEISAIADRADKPGTGARDAGTRPKAR